MLLKLLSCMFGDPYSLLCPLLLWLCWLSSYSVYYGSSSSLRFPSRGAWAHPWGCLLQVFDTWLLANCSFITSKVILRHLNYFCIALMVDCLSSSAPEYDILTCKKLLVQQIKQGLTSHSLTCLHSYDSHSVHSCLHSTFLAFTR